MSIYPDSRTPDWYRDAKLGIFIHWGIYSVPGWAPTGATFQSALDDFSRLPYAEWYANSLRLPGSETRRHHDEVFGAGVGYEDLADQWRAERFDPAGWADLFRDSGARYVIPTTKHADGFALWDTATTPFTAARRGPRRDLIREIEGAVRGAGMRFGLYYSGLIDWHAQPLAPLRALADVAEGVPEFTPQSRSHADYSYAQLDELIHRFRPDVLWNDMGWPQVGKGPGPRNLPTLLETYYQTVPDGVVNDRLAISHHGFRTVEYGHGDRPESGAWEATRGLGNSFGYNSAETDDDLISVTDLVCSFADIVARGGNLLLNVGPRGDGTIPDIQQARLAGLGEWLATNGEAIYGTRQWRRPDDELRGTPVLYTATTDRLNVIVPGPVPTRLHLPPDVAQQATGRARLLGTDCVLNIVDGAVEMPSRAPRQPATVLTLDVKPE